MGPAFGYQFRMRLDDNPSHPVSRQRFNVAGRCGGLKSVDDLSDRGVLDRSEEDPACYWLMQSEGRQAFFFFDFHLFATEPAFAVNHGLASLQSRFADLVGRPYKKGDPVRLLDRLEGLTPIVAVIPWGWGSE